MNKLPIDREQQQQIAQDYQQLFLMSDTGVNVLEDLLHFCGDGLNPYVEGSFDLTAQKCGKLAVALYIKKKLTAKDEPKQKETE